MNSVLTIPILQYYCTTIPVIVIGVLGINCDRLKDDGCLSRWLPLDNSGSCQVGGVSNLERIEVSAVWHGNTLHNYIENISTSYTT